MDGPEPRVKNKIEATVTSGGRHENVAARVTRRDLHIGAHLHKALPVVAIISSTVTGLGEWPSVRLKPRKNIFSRGVLGISNCNE